MKRTAILALALAALLCGFRALAEDWSAYAGRTYTGPDPWEGTLTVTVDSIGENGMAWTWTEDFLGETFTQSFEGTEFTDGEAAFHLEGAVLENDYTTVDYTGTLALRDGAVLVTFQAGEMTEHSSEGGSTAYHVEALEEEARTVALQAE